MIKLLTTIAFSFVLMAQAPNSTEETARQRDTYAVYSAMLSQHSNGAPALSDEVFFIQEPTIFAATSPATVTVPSGLESVFTAVAPACHRVSRSGETSNRANIGRGIHSSEWNAPAGRRRILVQLLCEDGIVVRQRRLSVRQDLSPQPRVLLSG